MMKKSRGEMASYSLEMGEIASRVIRGLQVCQGR